MLIEPRIDVRGTAVVAWYKGLDHKYYEDSFRLLSRDVPVVGALDRGEIYAVFDGIGGHPMGQSSAIKMADTLTRFYTEPENFENSINGLTQLLMEGNQEVYDWGFVPGTNRLKGGCCGSIAWIKDNLLTVFHAGDTSALHLTFDNHIRLSKADQFDAYLVTKCFGQGRTLKMDINSVKVEPYDQILLYSDGISKVISTEEGLDIINKFDDPKNRAATLARSARNRGARDDITVLCAEIPDDEE